MKTRTCNIVGIGFGPSNLATAIALSEAGIDDYLFLEKQSTFSWHPEMTLKEANLQNSFLKDLITLKNPKSSFTFLNYLSECGRIEDFVNRRCFFPNRREITDYMAWAAKSFSNHVLYDAMALRIFPESGNRIIIEYKEEKNGEISSLSCTHLILGIGAQPYIPFHIQPHPSFTHTAEMLGWLKSHNFHPDIEKSFLVIGGGQSSAEVVYHLLESYTKAKVRVVSRRFIYRSLEESAFINNLFSEKGMNWFSSTTSSAQKVIFKDLYEANFSAVDNSLVTKIYEILYEERRQGIDRVQFFSYCELFGLCHENGQFHGTVQDRAYEILRELYSDYVIFATGYRYTNVASFLKPFQDVLIFDEDNIPLRNDDYSLKTSGNFNGKIFAHAIGDKKFGFTEGGMTNLAARSMRIIETIQNSMLVQV